MMPLEIREEPFSVLPEYSKIPISFLVGSVFDVIESDDRSAPFELVERRLEYPWIKDYDTLYENSPADWPRQFDLSNWGLISAFSDGRRAGGAVIAFDTPAAEMLEGRRDLAVLWDLRIAPEYRRRGLGRLLNAAIGKWACQRNCHEIKLETQNINVPACRFYADQGYSLQSIKRFAYRELPDEIQLIWSKRL